MNTLGDQSSGRMPDSHMFEQMVYKKSTLVYSIALKTWDLIFFLLLFKCFIAAHTSSQDVGFSVTGALFVHQSYTLLAGEAGIIGQNLFSKGRPMFSN